MFSSAARASSPVLTATASPFAEVCRRQWVEAATNRSASTRHRWARGVGERLVAQAGDDFPDRSAAAEALQFSPAGPAHRQQQWQRLVRCRYRRQAERQPIRLQRQHNLVARHRARGIPGAAPAGRAQSSRAPSGSDVAQPVEQRRDDLLGLAGRAVRQRPQERPPARRAAAGTRCTGKTRPVPTPKSAYLSAVHTRTAARPRYGMVQRGNRQPAAAGRVGGEPARDNRLVQQVRRQDRAGQPVRGPQWDRRVTGRRRSRCREDVVSHDPGARRPPSWLAAVEACLGMVDADRIPQRVERGGHQFGRWNVEIPDVHRRGKDVGRWAGSCRLSVFPDGGVGNR